MIAKSLDQHIRCTPGVLGGKPCIAGRRISVEAVMTWHLKMRWSIDRIAREFDLTPASIHAALAYYFDHKEQIDRKMAGDQEWIDEQRRRTHSLLNGKPRGRGRWPRKSASTRTRTSVAR